MNKIIKRTDITMLEKFYNEKEVAKVLLSRKEYKPFPKYEDRQAWDSVAPEIREKYLTPEFKKNILEFDTTALTATAYMERYRTGGKGTGAWSRIVQRRRDFLFDATLAECFEHKGEYIDKIIDILWAICEESTWIPPEHINHMHNHMYTGVLKLALPDVTEHNFIDLYSGMCAGTLGWTYYFLKERLDEESPLLAKRIEYEINNRIIIPFMTHDDLTWFGFHGHKINNWNPWILSSIVPAVLSVSKDDDFRVEFFTRVLEKFDIYVNNCAEDGASDEGPGYWNVGGGACLDVFELIYDATNGGIDMLNTDFARNVAEYIAHANMKDDLYANFADSGMNLYVGYFAYRYAKITGSEYLKSFVLSKKEAWAVPTINIVSMYRHLKCMFGYSEMKNTEKTEFIHKDVWLADSQHFYARSNDGRVALASKGGYNNESHNHNDLGSFIYMLDGEAAICDLGGLQYTAKAFSPFRYDFWIVNSTAHNCARIGKYQEHDGDDYKSYEVCHSLTDGKASLTLELKEAYDKAAGIVSYKRTLDLDKNTGTLDITDDIQLDNAADVDVHFITQHEVQLADNGVDIILRDGKRVNIACEGVVSFEYHYNMRQDEEHFMSDKKVLDDGRKCDCTRIVFTFDEPAAHRVIRSTVSYS